MILLDRCREHENGQVPILTLSRKGNLAGTACGVLSLVSGGRLLGRSRSRGLGVHQPRAHAFAVGTEPWGTYQFLWRHSAFFTGR